MAEGGAPRLISYSFGLRSPAGRANCGHDGFMVDISGSCVLFGRVRVIHPTKMPCIFNQGSPSFHNDIEGVQTRVVLNKAS